MHKGTTVNEECPDELQVFSVQQGVTPHKQKHVSLTCFSGVLHFPDVNDDTFKSTLYNRQLAFNHLQLIIKRVIKCLREL